MIESQETQPKVSLEAPYISAVKARVAELLPEESQKFNNFFDLMNEELMGQGEGKGLFVWESKKYKGVRFLAGHIHISKDWIKKLSSQKLESPFQLRRRIKSQVRFIQPAFGRGNDGSALSVLDMAFSPALDITHTIATAIKSGEEPLTGDIYLLGSPTAIGGKTTGWFNGKVNAARERNLGFNSHGEIYAEFMREHLPQNPKELKGTRVVLEGVSKGTITADRTTRYLTELVKDRTQVLLDNPAGVHGNGLPTKIGRGANMLLFLAEASVRRNIIGKVLSKTQPQFYKDISQRLNLEEDSEEQKKLKGELAHSELVTLWHGNPINKREKRYIRISTPDTANISFKAIRRALYLKFKEKPTIQDWAYQEGEAVIFPNSNKLHMWNWERNIKSGSWSRKMDSIIRTKVPDNIIES